MGKLPPKVVPPAVGDPVAERPASPVAPHAFTLIELLATIAIIALLGGLLLPVLNRGKASAQRVKCASNLRQLGMAVQMYWDENDGDCFSYGGTPTNGGRWYWFGWLGAGPEGQRAFDATPGALYPYLVGRGVSVCPSLDYALQQFKLKATEAAYGYGVNLHLTAPQLGNVIRVVRLEETVLFADAAQVNTFQAPASRQNPMLEEFYYVSTNANEATAHFRHARQANAVFVDGHVARENPLPGSIDQYLPSQWVGRLRPECLRVP